MLHRNQLNGFKKDTLHHLTDHSIASLLPSIKKDCNSLRNACPNFSHGIYTYGTQCTDFTLI